MQFHITQIDLFLGQYVLNLDGPTEQFMKMKINAN